MRDLAANGADAKAGEIDIARQFSPCHQLPGAPDIGVSAAERLLGHRMPGRMGGKGIDALRQTACEAVPDTGPFRPTRLRLPGKIKGNDAHCVSPIGVLATQNLRLAPQNLRFVAYEFETKLEPFS
jgi:hypothetical protein